MTIEAFAAMLTGREYCDEISKDEEKLAKELNYLVVFGASDDLMELHGAIYDEVNATDGGEAYIKEGKLLPALDDESDIEVLQKYDVLEIVQKAHLGAMKIEAKWCPAGTAYSWIIETPAPHATFEILEDGEPFCRGIVVDLKWSLNSPKPRLSGKRLQ